MDRVAPLSASADNSQSEDILLIDAADIVPKSAIGKKEIKPQLDLSKSNQKVIDLPKWPYVENLWNKVDKIMGDLLEPDELKTNKISNVGNVISSLQLDTSELDTIENESLYNNLNTVPATSTETSRPDQQYWQNLKQKYGFISAY